MSVGGFFCQVKKEQKVAFCKTAKPKVPRVPHFQITHFSVIVLSPFGSFQASSQFEEKLTFVGDT